MTKMTYTLQQDYPRLGRRGDQVGLHPKEAKYLVLAGTVVEGKVKLPAPVAGPKAEAPADKPAKRGR